MRSSRQQPIALVLVVCLAVLAAVCGCGGGGSGSSEKGDNSPQIITPLFPVRSDSSGMDFAVAHGPGAINERGQVAGVREISGGSDALLWETDGVQVLDGGPIQPPSRLVVTDINDTGDVIGADVGGSYPLAIGSWNAIVWRQGAMSRLATLPGTDVSVAQSINRSGHIVGMARGDRMPSRAVLWQDGQVTALADADLPSEAIAINDSGTIIGSIGARQVVWENGTARTLLVTAVPSWQSGHTLFAINSAGTIVGEDDGDSSQGKTGGFVLSGRRPVSLPRLGSYDGVAPRAISDRGWIVGHAYDIELSYYVPTRTVQTAVLWRDGQVIDLNRLLPPGSGWNLREATGINATGAITGIGSYNGVTHQFLLQVPPAP